MFNKITILLLLQVFSGFLAISQNYNYNFTALEESLTVNIALEPDFKFINNDEEFFSDLLPLFQEPMKIKRPSHFKLGSGLELGLSGGLFLIEGDISRGIPESYDNLYDLTNFGNSVKLRFSLNNVFSIRSEFLYGKASGNSDGKNPSLKGFSSLWTSGTLWSLFNLNSILNPDKEKKIAINLMFGCGANSSTVLRYGSIKFRPNESEISTIKFDLLSNSIHRGTGINITYSLSSNFSIGLETQAIRARGARANILDGWEDESGFNFLPKKDIVKFINLSLNYRFGKKQDNSATNFLELLNNVINDMSFPLIDEN
jgi:hypothetical protein